MPRLGKTRLTPVIIDRVATRLSDGMPIRYALSLEPKPISLRMWEDFMSKHPKSQLRVDKIIATQMSLDLAGIRAAQMKNLPGAVWLLERRYPEYFANNRNQGPQVQVNIVAGMSADIMRRAGKIALSNEYPAIESMIGQKATSPHRLKDAGIEPTKD